MSELHYPLLTLREGNWFKLICGASFQHLPAVRNLTLAYTLAGADCIDVAADPAVVRAALDALHVARQLGEEAQARGFELGHQPLLMVSLNDGEDPHFRKAEFNPDLCPADCPRPCETICPAQAIIFQNATSSNTGEGKPGKEKAGEMGKIPLNPQLVNGFSGVIDQRCYGCGRCLPICPSQIIYTRSYVSAPEAIAPLILPVGVDALEIHTQVGHFADFQRLWKALTPWVNQLKLLAISCPDGEGLIDYLWALHDLISPLPCPLLWQTDGRPMSGDIGIGATRAAVKLAQKVVAAELPGYVQLAGGTNHHTVAKLQAAGLLKGGRIRGQGGKILNTHPAFVTPSALASIPKTQPYVAGIAYGSYARVLLSPILEELENRNGKHVYSNLAPLQSPSLERLEESPDLLWQAVTLARSLISQIKSYPTITATDTTFS